MKRTSKTEKDDSPARTVDACSLEDKRNLAHTLGSFTRGRRGATAIGAAIVGAVGAIGAAGAEGAVGAAGAVGAMKVMGAL
jgi:hypothetical protein